MNTKRFAGMISIVAAVTLCVVGVDRGTKDAKARQVITPLQVASVNSPLAAPVGPTSTVHFQIDPGQAPLPPIVIGKDNEPPMSPPAAAPKESEPPPLISTGELEKQLKQSIDNLQKVLPQLPGGEESSAPPPAPPLPQEPKIGSEKKAPPLPPSTNEFVPITPAANPTAAPPKVDPPRNVLPEQPFSNVPSPPPMAFESDAHKPINPPIIQSPSALQPIQGATTISSQDIFQKRLAEVEMKYLKEMIGELERRMQAMPVGEERRKVALDHQRYAERLARMIKAADMVMDRHIVQTGGVKEPITDSPWTMHLETTDGKTVLQAMVHRKAKFKVVCDRLDLQSPRGTMLAVGHVQLSGEGFMGACDRLSIPLHDDRLILEGNAEVGVRTQPVALIDERREGVPPSVEPRKPEESTSAAVPVLHLKGDHLDLRWNDSQPTATTSSRSDDSLRPSIKGTPGPMVKVAFNSLANEKWSEWGTFLALPVAPGEANGPRKYAIQNRDGQILAFVRAPASMSLQEYIGKRVSVFGLPIREEGRTVMTYTASHVAWE